MAKVSPNVTAEIVQGVIRKGVVQFVVRFATRHRVEGLPAKAAAAQALEDMAHRAMRRLLGNAGFAPGDVFPPPRAGRRRNRRRPAARKRRGLAGPPVADLELERLEKLKAYVAGTGPDPEAPRRRTHGNR